MRLWGLAGLRASPCILPRCLALFSSLVDPVSGRFFFCAKVLLAYVMSYNYKHVRVSEFVCEVGFVSVGTLLPLFICSSLVCSRKISTPKISVKENMLFVSIKQLYL